MHIAVGRIALVSVRTPVHCAGAVIYGSPRIVVHNGKRLSGTPSQRHYPDRMALHDACRDFHIHSATGTGPPADPGNVFHDHGRNHRLAVGLLGFSISSSLTLRYAYMILATIAGIAFGFLLYTNTPSGKPVGPGSGNFFRYLLAKGFPTAITLMMLGVALVLLIAVKNVNGL